MDLLLLVTLAVDINKGLMAIGAGIAVLTGIGAGIGQGIAASKACEAIARNPEVEPKIRTNMILGIALAETTGLYGLIIAILILFVYR